MIAHHFHALRNILDNPYQYSAAIVAKLSINAATILWCVVVIWKENALGSIAGYREMTTILSENQWALMLLTISFISLVRLFVHAKPVALGALIYGLLAIFWLYLLTLEVSSAAPIHPGRFAALTVVTALGVFAFIANPKRAANGDT